MPFDQTKTTLNEGDHDISQTVEHRLQTLEKRGKADSLDPTLNEVAKDIVAVED